MASGVVAESVSQMRDGRWEMGDARCEMRYTLQEGGELAR